VKPEEEKGEKKFKVSRTKPFLSLLKDEVQKHKELERDIVWLEGRLAIGPVQMGDHVSGLKNLNLPVYKTRLKDSCCGLSTSEGWRFYYAVSKASNTVYMLFFHHKKEIENPGKKFLQQKISKAFEG
jgi:hypothetical protein